MKKDLKYIRWLAEEAVSWVERGIISRKQKESILALYDETPADVQAEQSRTVAVESERESASLPQYKEKRKTETHRAPINLARVVIGLATLCIVAGVTVFYASNWRKMPPVAKLIQVFALIIGFYGASFVFLFSKWRSPMIGRALLFIGMVTYGVGIMLVAQVYHISAQPTHGVLAWALGVIIMAALMRDRYGLYLASLLFFVWNVWSLAIVGGPVYLFGLFAAALWFLFYREKDRIGIIVSSSLVVWYLYQISIYWISEYASDGLRGAVIIVIMVLAGAALRFAGMRLRDHEFFKQSGYISFIAGCGFHILPAALVLHVQLETANLVLVWALGVLAVSAINRERWGVYIALALSFVWNCAEFILSVRPFDYSVPLSIGMFGPLLYLYIVFVATIGFIFYRMKDRIGLLLTSLCAVWYLFQVSLFWIFTFGETGLKGYLVIGAVCAIGAGLRMLGSNIMRDDLLKYAGNVFAVSGWIALALPLALVLRVPALDAAPLVLAWATGVLAVSLRRNDSPGVYAAAGLFYVWNIWQLAYSPNPNYWFIIPIAFIGALSLYRKNRSGITLSVCGVGWYIFQIFIYHLRRRADDGLIGYLFIAGAVLLGIACMELSRRIRGRELLRGAGIASEVCAWIALLLPFTQIVVFGRTSTPEGILVWAIGILVVAVVMRQKYAIYFSMLLFVIWESWTFIKTDTPSYWFILAVLIAGFVSYRRGYKGASVVSALSVLFWIGEIIVFWSWKAAGSAEPFASLIVLFLIPLGALMAAIGRLIRTDRILGSTGLVVSVAGWIIFSLPFFLISWPGKMEEFPYLLSSGEMARPAIAYVVLAAATSGAVYLLMRRREAFKLLLVVTGVIVALFFVPMASTTARMVSIHISIIALISALLYCSYTKPEERPFVRVYAFVFTIGMIIVKGIGFTSNSVIESEYRLANLIGIILFTIVCFLVNRLIHHQLKRKNISYPVTIIDAVCAVCIWISIYCSSFEIGMQKSIFDADRVVVIMIVLFVAIAVGLYGFILSRVREGMMIIRLSLVVFIASGLTLFISGPHVSWIVYSIVFNLLLLLTSVVYIYYSAVIQSRIVLNLAVTAFVLHIVTRYFDLFWDMLSGALLFIATGIIGLIGGYFLEKKRRGLSNRIKSGKMSDHRHGEDQS
jgi:uncharacterized membrane protein